MTRGMIYGAECAGGRRFALIFPSSEWAGKVEFGANIPVDDKVIGYGLFVECQIQFARMVKVAANGMHEH